MKKILQHINTLPLFTWGTGMPPNTPQLGKYHSWKQRH